MRHSCCVTQPPISMKQQLIEQSLVMVVGIYAADKMEHLYLQLYAKKANSHRLTYFCSLLQFPFYVNWLRTI